MLAQILTQYETEESAGRAVRYAEMALALSRQRGDVGEELWRLGNAFLAQQDLDRARSLYQESLELAERSGDDTLAANCLGNLGMVAYRSWRLDEAIDFTKRALDYDKRIGHRTRILESTLNLGTFYQMRGDAAAARPLLLEALVDARGDWIITTLCQESLADLERDQGRHENTQRYLSAAARLCAKVGVPQKQAFYLGLLSESYWLVGKARLAIETLEEAVRVGEGLTLSHAFILVQLGQLDDARDWLGRFQEQEPDPDRRAAARLALARMDWWSGDDASARSRCAEALEFLMGTKIKRFYLPAQALAACIGQRASEAVDVLEDARRNCSGHVFPEVALDVGTLLAKADADTTESALADRYLWATTKLASGGVCYRLEDLRARLHRRLGQPEKARASLARARNEVDRLLEELPEEHRALFEEHEWVRDLRRHRLVP